MTARFRVTPRAMADLKNIGRFTLERWGREQRDAYLRGLDERFHWLAGDPLKGRKRDDVAPGYRSFGYRSHIVFYLIRDDGIDVIGVPHQAMDVAGHLAGNDAGKG